MEVAATAAAAANMIFVLSFIIFCQISISQGYVSIRGHVYPADAMQFDEPTRPINRQVRNGGCENTDNFPAFVPAYYRRCSPQTLIFINPFSRQAR